jgi:hypothetical protein
MEVSYIQHYVVAIQSMNFVPMTCTSPKIPLTVSKKISNKICSLRFGTCSLFVWLVADGWCWFVLREKSTADWFLMTGFF